MKESYIEGLASRNGPESCAGNRKGTGEALTGVRAGRIWSREIRCNQSADDVVLCGKQHGYVRQGECMSGSARSKTPCMYGNSMRENREILCPPAVNGAVGRNGKVGDHNPLMNGQRKSDRPIVPAKLPNNAGSTAAEAVEERGLTKGNANKQNTRRTQGRNNRVPNALDRVRRVAYRNKDEKFTALLHHVTKERLTEAFFAIRKKAVPGVDGVTWYQYEAELTVNIENLYERVHRGSYRAKPSQRAYIPKSDGRQRPLSIAVLEDKIVQRAVAQVLNSVYEADFLGFSYGFRPGRHPHQALDALAVGIRFKKVSWVLDADIRSYLDHPT